SSRRRHTRSKRDWSSDLCSSDLKSSNSSNNHERTTQFRLTFHKNCTYNAKIEKNKADQTKPVILLLSVLLKAPSKSPKNKTTNAPRKPKTPTYKTNKKSVLLPNEPS